MANLKVNKMNFPAVNTTGRSYGHQMTVKDKERASVVEVQSEGF